MAARATPSCPDKNQLSTVRFDKVLTDYVDLKSFESAKALQNDVKQVEAINSDSGKTTIAARNSDSGRTPELLSSLNQFTQEPDEFLQPKTKTNDKIDRDSQQLFQLIFNRSEDTKFNADADRQTIKASPFDAEASTTREAPSEDRKNGSPDAGTNFPKGSPPLDESDAKDLALKQTASFATSSDNFIEPNVTLDTKPGINNIFEDILDDFVTAGFSFSTIEDRPIVFNPTCVMSEKPFTKSEPIINADASLSLVLPLTPIIPSLEETPQTPSNMHLSPEMTFSTSSPRSTPRLSPCEQNSKISLKDQTYRKASSIL
jgi:hypothetical protein